MSRRRNHSRARWTAALKWGVPTLLATASGMLVAVPAQAASLELTTGWSNNDVPTYISMYLYVPNTVATKPPIMVAAHYCGGSASAYYSFDSSVVALANTYGFIMIFPQTTNPASSADCWDVGSTKSLTHNGGGDTQAIAEMVQYTITKYNADAGRVYSMGSSSGAMLTEALMGVYPEIFKAGAEMSGVPDGCWSDGWSAASNWGGACASGDDTMTAAAWGNLVRAQYPGYMGTRPRLWLWVGTADTTISPTNFTQSILEWTNVLNLSSTPTSTSAPNNAQQQQGSGQLWSNSCGDTVLEAWSLQGGGHAPVPTASTATAIVSYFGLDKEGPDLGAGCADAGSTTGTTTGTTTATTTSTTTATSTGTTTATTTSTTTGAATGTASSTTTGATTGTVTSTTTGATTGAATSATTGTTTGAATSTTTGAEGGDAGASGDNGNGMGSAGCGCRVGPVNERSGGLLFAPLGAALGILVRRRRRSRA